MSINKDLPIPTELKSICFSFTPTVALLRVSKEFAKDIDIYSFFVEQYKNSILLRPLTLRVEFSLPGLPDSEKVKGIYDLVRTNARKIPTGQNVLFNTGLVREKPAVADTSIVFQPKVAASRLEKIAEWTATHKVFRDAIVIFRKIAEQFLIGRNFLATLDIERLGLIQASQQILAWMDDNTGILAAVRNLSLGDHNLSSFPRVFAHHLTGLLSLNLSDNQISNLEVPENLLQLNLNNTQITQLPEGIRRATQLKHLFIAQNELTELPTWTGEFTNLETLQLSGNKLKALPAEVGGAIALKNLCLDNNQLTALPAAIWQLPALEFLHLRNNQFKEHPRTNPRAGLQIKLDGNPCTRSSTAEKTESKSDK